MAEAFATEDSERGAVLLRSGALADRKRLTVKPPDPTLECMEAANITQQVPFQADAEGVIRVGGTRVTLDTLVAAFGSGATPEEIAQQYPSLSLADIYSVIGYYLRHQAEVQQYLAERERKAGQVRKENERRFDPSGVRERLLARRR